eukprot:CAMPEP_0115251196 /NCGR_PEP_ID=MMETSP0270-20121206/43501_1 /TAXON_ID=71861 /ORGANISM="Scrippsiella trochoidea, Strain CCMP3099" /LENGTH=170 /DNA_ID=CAMNT_0002666601 /DNA_START=155 /DNA_END=667 /DNA_ORIENTATION=+
MTTSETVMGIVPKDDGTIAVPDTTIFSAGSSVTISFDDVKFTMGLAHASAGDFSDRASFTTRPWAGCAGNETIIYKAFAAAGTKGSITWTAPADVASLPSVTLSFAGSPSYGQVYRHQVTLERAAARRLPASSSGGVTSAAKPAVSSGLSWKLLAAACSSISLLVAAVSG